MPAPTELDDLIRTHAKLRDIIVLASARIKRQALGHQDYELLKSMRETLIEGRAVARQFEKRQPPAKHVHERHGDEG
jgi:hypothetical protein